MAQELKAQNSGAVVLITGASGFVGSALSATLIEQGYQVRRALRQADDQASDDGNTFIVGDVATADWSAALDGVHAVIHLAASAHVMHDDAADPLALYRRTNVEGTQNLARAALRAGVQRFIFLSSIKVNGERTSTQPFRESDVPHPEDPYGISKREAEKALTEIACGTAMQTVILRPPLLYGPRVKGNFLKLLGLVNRGLPLPFASVRNKRCLLYVGNLTDAIALCLQHPAAANKTYLLADDDGVSTPELVRAIAEALHKAARLIGLPPILLKTVAALAGKSAAAHRLLGSLQVDSSAIRKELAWTPPYTMADGLAQTAQWYHRAVRRE